MCQLYLKEQGSKLGICGRRLIVSKDEQELLSCPAHLVDRIILEGRVQVSTAALCLLLDKGINLVLTNSKGFIRGSLVPPDNPDISIRKKQYKLSDDKSYCSNFMFDMIAARINNFCLVLQRYSYNHKEFDFTAEINEIKSQMNSISPEMSIEMLRGYEGMAAKHYFAGLVKIFQSLNIGFEGRIRRPPTDPVNSLMSYIYVILTALVSSIIQSIGLDVYCGFIHFENRNAPALALDFVEQFRQSIADRFILLMFNNRILKAEHFVKDGNLPCVLTKDAKNRTIEEWEKFLITPQSLTDKSDKITPYDIIKLKTEQFKDSIVKSTNYNHFRLSKG